MCQRLIMCLMILHLLPFIWAQHHFELKNEIYNIHIDNSKTETTKSKDDLTRRCHVKGICTGDSKFQGESHAVEVKECVAKCNEEPECFWSTFDPNVNVCTMFSTCQHFERANCLNCTTTKKDCLAADCIVSGECVGGKFEGNVFAQDITKCSNFCKQDVDCSYSTFDLDEMNCNKFSTCPKIQMSTCLNCKTYEKKCDHEAKHLHLTNNITSKPLPQYLQQGFYRTRDSLVMACKRISCKGCVLSQKRTVVIITVLFSDNTQS